MKVLFIMNFRIGIKNALCLLIWLYPLQVNAQVPPSTPGVTVHANYRLGPSVGIICYDYTVSNPATNSSSVDSVAIDISKITNTADVARDGVTNGSGVTEEVNNAVLQNVNATPMVAVGMSSPPGWSASLSVDGIVEWIPINQQLSPGVELSGLEVCSRGLPTIRHFFAQPYLDIDTLPIVPPNGTEADLQRYKSELQTLEINSGTTGNTLGPSGPPTSFVSVDFLTTIISYKEQAVQQGWIDNSGIANSLDAKLNAAQASLKQGDTSTARNQLDALSNEVDAQAGKHLVPEAVALLKFNTQYLISQLP